MTDLLSSSQFWLLVSIGFYALGVEIQKKTGSAVCNPLLIASILVGALLIATGTPYQTYEESGKADFVLPDAGNGSACDPDLPQAGCTAEKPCCPFCSARLSARWYPSAACCSSAICRSERKHDAFSRAEIGNNSDCSRGSRNARRRNSITAIAVVITGIIGAIILRPSSSASACAIRCRWACPSARQLTQSVPRAPLSWVRPKARFPVWRSALPVC